MDALIAATPSFLATIVEAVEALTIVLAVGMTRGWRATFAGVAVAAAILTGAVAVFGSAIVTLVPVDALRLVVGGFLVLFGLQWLQKAILRAAGAKAKHNEDAIFAAEVAALAAEPPLAEGRFDWVAFTVALKGVLLEGLEVVVIVLTFGLSSGRLDMAAAGAVAAGALVLAVGAFVHRPLSRVPENGLKLGVGLMLVTFGTFWSGEGLGIEWPASDAVLLVLLAAYAVAALVAIELVLSVRANRRTRPYVAPTASSGAPEGG
jgi:uncharacterized membrane protein